MNRTIYMSVDTSLETTSNDEDWQFAQKALNRPKGVTILSLPSSQVEN